MKCYNCQHETRKEETNCGHCHFPVKDSIQLQNKKTDSCFSDIFDFSSKPKTEQVHAEESRIRTLRRVWKPEIQFQI